MAKKPIKMETAEEAKAKAKATPPMPEEPQPKMGVSPLEAITFQPPVEISVVDCCGVFGHLIPWSLWKCRNPPIVPTRNFKQPYIYLFSSAGQFAAEQIKHRITPCVVLPPTPLPEGVIGSVNLDQYVAIRSQNSRLGSYSNHDHFHV